MTTQQHIIELAESNGIPRIVVAINPAAFELFYHAARNEGLEAAKQAAIDAIAFNGGTVQMESHVRQAIEKLKEQK